MCSSAKCVSFCCLFTGAKLNPRWASTNAWRVKNKGKWLLRITVSPKGNWSINHWHITCNYFLDILHGECNDSVLFEKYKEIVLSNLRYCKGCASCKPGTNKVIFGENFDLLCHGFFNFTSPDATTIECAKMLLECKKKAIANL